MHHKLRPYKLQSLFAVFNSYFMKLFKTKCKTLRMHIMHLDGAFCVRYCKGKEKKISAKNYLKQKIIVDHTVQNRADITIRPISGFFMHAPRFSFFSFFC